MSRVVVFHLDAGSGQWWGRWEGEHVLALSTTLSDCRNRFCAAVGIAVDNLMNPEKWAVERRSPDVFRLTEIVPATPARVPRQAKLEYLGKVWVGWWLDRPDEKVEGPDADEVTRLLADKIQIPRADFLREILTAVRWKTERLLTGTYTITEILPDASAPVCPECQGMRTVELFTSKGPCSLCCPQVAP